MVPIKPTYFGRFDQTKNMTLSDLDTYFIRVFSRLMPSVRIRRIWTGSGEELFGKWLIVITIG